MRSAKAQYGRAQNLEKTGYQGGGRTFPSFARRQYVQQISEHFFRLSLRTRVDEDVQWALQQQTHLMVAAVAFLKLDLDLTWHQMKEEILLGALQRWEVWRQQLQT